MCGQTENHHGSRNRGHHGNCGCGCGGHSHFERRFSTKAEKIAELEQYLESLQNETQAVEEHIAALKEEA